MIKRALATIVLYAMFGLVLAISDGLNPSLGWYEGWLDSLTFKIVVLVVLWFVAPLLVRVTEKGKLGPQAEQRDVAK
jgi:hypothetical protein